MTKLQGIDKSKKKPDIVGITHFFVIFFLNKENCQNSCLWGNLGNSGEDRGGDNVLNSNHLGTGQGKMAIPRVPRGIPTPNLLKKGN